MLIHLLQAATCFDEGILSNATGGGAFLWLPFSASPAHAATLGVLVVAFGCHACLSEQAISTESYKMRTQQEGENPHDHSHTMLLADR